MSLRSRVTLAAAGAVVAALAVGSVVIYYSVRSKLHDQIDISLVRTADNVSAKFVGAARLPPPKLPPGTYPKSFNSPKTSDSFLATDAAGYFQIIPKLKETVLGGNANPNGFVPLGKTDEEVAGGVAPAYFRDVVFHGTAMRLYTERLGNTDGLVRTARPLTETSATLGRVRWLLLVLTLGGGAAAALLGRLAAAAVLRPVRVLASTVEDVTATRDLSRRIAVEGRDEVGSLAHNFNQMLGALDASLQAQQQLIADASHELRTPLTAHRTNIELLARPDLPPERRTRVLAAAVRSVEDLSALVTDLIQAARNGKSVDARAPVRLDRLAEAAVERARRRTPEVRFETSVEPCTVTGASGRLERALDNVLENAAKWSADGGTVRVAVADGVVTVRDHGLGIDESDLPHIFDRFYRAASARGLPGSGLGLAIVKQTVEDHGGTVTAANADGGGAVVSLQLPVA
jgi:two-component system, OmpR family, sensor histidine kinase MprB